MKKLSSFKINRDHKVFDYRLGNKLNLKEIIAFFNKNYQVQKIWSGERYVLGILEKNGRDYFLKLATSRGISLLTENEFNWNESFNQEIKRENSSFWVPQNYDCGYYNKELFYLITDRFEGQMLARHPEKQKISETFIRNLTKVIDFSELIQNLTEINLNNSFETKNMNYQDRFINKTKLWYQDIPKIIINKFEVNKLLDFVINNASKLTQKPRHGDFTPWHLMELRTGQFGLIDGEHALADGVEDYDIAYFIQRVFSVLKNPKLAKNIFSQLQKRNYSVNNLKTVLAARAIGGYLDESLTDDPSYRYAHEFQKWTLSL